MSLTLYHHPLSRAAAVVWMLEEVECDYRLEHVDILGGSNKNASFRALNPMGKLPTLVDDDVVVTEAAAIALYLGDRFALGRLAPPPNSPERGPYLRWSFYAPAVIEPGCMANAARWKFHPSQAGWGTYEEMLDTISVAIGEGPWLLGERFSMGDVVFGGTVRWMVKFGLLDKRPEYTEYIERLNARPASIKAEEINTRIIEEHGLSGT